MGGLLGLIVLAVVVVAVAYALGVYWRRQNEAPGKRPASRILEQKPKRAPVTPEERELQAVISWLLTQAFEQTGVRVANERLAYERIAEAAQKAIQTLKTQPSVTISLPFLTADASGPKHFETQLTRGVVQELGRY